MTEPHEHAWAWNDRAMCWHCAGCHGVSYSVACEAAKPPCAPAEPERAPPAPAIADMLDRALSRRLGGFDAIDKEFKH